MQILNLIILFKKAAVKRKFEFKSKAFNKAWPGIRVSCNVVGRRIKHNTATKN